MRRLCPTLSELNAFHSAAKHQAFTMAAKELCVTQSAISRHIASLEDYLGQKLFIRRSSGLELTDAGATYLNATRPAIAALESATAQLMSYGGDGGALNLSVPPTFAAQWLFPRLGHFKRTLPQVSLNFVRYQHAHDFAVPHEFDAAIQYGYGNWPSANARYLIGQETSIVCSPQLRDTLPLRTQADLQHATLLQHIEVPLAWHDWMAANGCDTGGSRFGPGFNLYSLIIRAAVSGFGVGIVPTCLVEDELQAGTLVEPLGQRFQSPLGYYLCAPTARTNLSVYRLVSGWLEHCCSHAAGTDPGEGTSPAAGCIFCASGSPMAG
ncbi:MULTISPECIES: LysR substrate-binding domain-containing protein [unclassified Acidovorax]|uniref:LysR substrate-binding domain-containing protein n=1 Tax=unclassified Acidovorax TaxID=2684926 RepID=UPI0023DE3EF0|nr:MULTISPECIES: LysR substrate-binding domain-containing protein [Comamonadaceae]WOI43844.1 LysR substrate-binding domain-containing protein [Paracidovorax avenae]GKT01107.1 LysR family transcriptional regulator [Acidovorax sp. SUPP3434]